MKRVEKGIMKIEEKKSVKFMKKEIKDEKNL